MRLVILFYLCIAMLVQPNTSYAQSTPTTTSNAEIRAILAEDIDKIFDDKLFIEGYAVKLANAPKDILLAMINDDSLNTFKKSAALQVFRKRFASQVVQHERLILERVMLRQLEKSSSVFVQLELMHVLVMLDRYRYFDAMVPALIQKLDHYDIAVTDLAYQAMDDIINTGSNRTREARIVFNTLRKTLFLTRKKLQNMDPNDERIKNKLQILRWSVKVLGTEELKNLPKEVISLM